MAMTCDEFRTNLAQQTLQFSENFLKDFVSDMLVAPYVGRHKTETWTHPGDRIYFDKTHVMQPNFLTDWQVISAGLGGVGVDETCSNPCEVPAAYVGYGTTRDSAVME